MPLDPASVFIAFAVGRRLAEGPLPDVALAAKRHVDAGAPGPVQVFDAVTSAPVDLWLAGTDADVERLYRSAADVPPVPPAPRPTLAVESRRVGLLPRHWAWLDAQPGGASAALRRLVDAARVAEAPQEAVRVARERCYRFLSAALGDAPGFEEATRALFAGDAARFAAEAAAWPEDLRAHAMRLAAGAFTPSGSR